MTQLTIHLHNEQYSIEELQRAGLDPTINLTPMRDKLVALIEANDIGTLIMAHFVPINVNGSDAQNDVPAAQDFVYASSVILDVEDTDMALAKLKTEIRDTVFDGALELFTHEEMKSDTSKAAPTYKSIEVYYDIASIPEGYDHPLDFRNAAMELIETALEAADAGEWVGAESGMGEVNFGFEVADFDLAEKIVLKAVAGTPFAGIREMTRYDSVTTNI